MQDSGGTQRRPLPSAFWFSGVTLQLRRHRAAIQRGVHERNFQRNRRVRTMALPGCQSSNSAVGCLTVFAVLEEIAVIEKREPPAIYLNWQVAVPLLGCEISVLSTTARATTGTPRASA